MLPFQVDIDECLNCLRKGELILYPTDTVWGIGCDATNEKAVSKIYELKNRVDSKAMIVLVSHEEMILDIVDQKNLTIFDYIKGIHKPTTVIYQKAKNVASNVIGTDRSIAIRVTKELFSKNLIEQFGHFISTSYSGVYEIPKPIRTRAGVYELIKPNIKELTTFGIKNNWDSRILSYLNAFQDKIFVENVLIQLVL